LCLEDQPTTEDKTMSYYRIKAYALKACVAVLEWLGRLFVFNLSSPEVGREILDIRYGHINPRKQSLDVFVPAQSPPYPILVFIHGSGFHFLDKKSFRRVAKCFADRGYLVVSINYRLAPACGFPGQITDVAKAIHWAYDHASEYGGDNSRVFLAGDSAGAHYSSLYAAAVHEPGLPGELAIERSIPAACIRGLLLFYGSYDFETVAETAFPFARLLCRGFLGEDGEECRRRIEVASPARHVGKGFPPVYIFTGERDPMHTESLLFDKVLTRAGIPHKMLSFARAEYRDGQHGFLSVPFSRCSRIAMRESMEFLDSLN
jgi:acetyl esterase/lipase